MPRSAHCVTAHCQDNQARSHEGGGVEGWLKDDSWDLHKSDEIFLPLGGVPLHSGMTRRSHPEHSKYRKTTGRSGLRLKPRWRSSQRSLRLPSWWGGSWLPFPKNPTPAFSPSGLRRCGLSSNPPVGPILKTLASPLKITNISHPGTESNMKYENIGNTLQL